MDYGGKSEKFPARFKYLKAQNGSMAVKKKKKTVKKKVKKKAVKKVKKKILPTKEIKNLNEWYRQKLEERDKIIEKLKRENAVLLSTALRQGQKTKQIFDMAEKAMKKKRRLP